MTPTPTDPVTIDLGDGTPRKLRYSLATMRRLKNKFGQSMMDGTALQKLDEDKLPEILFEGLVDREGIADSNALAELVTFQNLPGIIEKFTLAFAGAMPEKKADETPNAPGQSPN